MFKGNFRESTSGFPEIVDREDSGDSRTNPRNWESVHIPEIKRQVLQFKLELLILTKYPERDAISRSHTEKTTFYKVLLIKRHPLLLPQERAGVR